MRRRVVVENARGSAELVTQPSEGRVVASVTTTRLLVSFLLRILLRHTLRSTQKKSYFFSQ